MSKNTKEKLLDSAIDIFAEKGFKAATVQQIADRAGANISAINYHFRDKANFYAEAVVRQIRKIVQENQIEAVDSDDPEVMLRQFIRQRINLISKKKRAQFMEKIMMQEMARPGPVMDKMVEHVIRPEFQRLAQIVSALLPSDCDEHEVRRHCLSIVGQCNFYLHAQPVMSRVFPELVLDEDEVEKLTDHIANISLAAFRAEHASRPQ